MRRTRAPVCRRRRQGLADSTRRPAPPDRSRRWAAARLARSRPPARALAAPEAACIGHSPAAPRNSRSSPAHMCRTRPGGRACHPRLADSTGRLGPSDRCRARALPARRLRSRPAAGAGGTCRSPPVPRSSRLSLAHMCRTRAPARRASRRRLACSTGRLVPSRRCRPRAAPARLAARSAAPSSSTTNRGKIPARRPHPDRGLPQGPARPARGRAIHGAVGRRRKVCPRPVRKEPMRSASQARSQGAPARRLERTAPQGCPHDTRPAICRTSEYQKTEPFRSKSDVRQDLTRRAVFCSAVF